MITEVEVRAHAKALWNAARQLPGLMVMIPRLGYNEAPKPHPLRVAVEQAVARPNTEHLSLYQDRLRPYDASDPSESGAWCGRLLMIPAKLYPTFESYVYVLELCAEGDIIAALHAVRESVEEVVNASKTA